MRERMKWYRSSCCQCNLRFPCTATLHNTYQDYCYTCKCKRKCPICQYRQQGSALIQSLLDVLACTHRHFRSCSSCKDLRTFPIRTLCRKTETGSRNNAKSALHLLAHPSSCRLLNSKILCIRQPCCTAIHYCLDM